MKKSFAARRAPKRIGDESDSDDTSAVPVKRPPLVTRSSKRKSAAASSRLSFGGTGGASSNAATAAASDTATSTGSAIADNNSMEDVTLPRRTGGLSRIALERSAAGKLPFRTGQDDERPTYDWQTLKALQNSTPSTPLDGASMHGDSEEENGSHKEEAMQVARTSAGTTSVIPSEAEIREKKLRRARLAKEQEYISLHGDEEEYDGPRDVIVRGKEDKNEDTRLVRDDEDFAEGFDEFVEDGHITLGRKAERQQKKQQRKEMEEMIARAEGSGSDDDTDVSEAERNAEYEAAQTRHGTYAQAGRRNDGDARPQVPAKITPVPDLAGVVASLKAALRSAKDARDATNRRLEELVIERADVAEREVWIQAQLKEMGEKYANVNNVEVTAGSGS